MKYFKKRVSKKRTLKPSKALTKVVKKIINKEIETKSYDNYNNLTADTTGSIVKLTSIPQSVGDQGRVGSIITPTGIQFDCIFTVVAADTTDAMRLLIFQWKPDDAADAPNMSELFESTTAGYQLVTPSKHVDRQRYHKLYDKVILLDNSMPQKHLKIRIKRLNKINFNDDLLTGQNHLYFAIFSDSGVAAHPTILYWSRTYYKDA